MSFWDHPFGLNTFVFPPNTTDKAGELYWTSSRYDLFATTFQSLQYSMDSSDATTNGEHNKWDQDTNNHSASYYNAKPHNSQLVGPLPNFEVDDTNGIATLYLTNEAIADGTNMLISREAMKEIATSVITGLTDEQHQSLESGMTKQCPASLRSTLYGLAQATFNELVQKDDWGVFKHSPPDDDEHTSPTLDLGGTCQIQGKGYPIQLMILSKNSEIPQSLRIGRPYADEDVVDIVRSTAGRYTVIYHTNPTITVGHADSAETCYTDFDLQERLLNAASHLITPRRIGKLVDDIEGFKKILKSELSKLHSALVQGDLRGDIRTTEPDSSVASLSEELSGTLVRVQVDMKTH
jgi:hypothetical protein